MHLISLKEIVRPKPMHSINTFGQWKNFLIDIEDSTITTEINEYTLKYQNYSSSRNC